MAFYGVAKYDNQSLLAGSKIRAYCNDELKGEIVLVEAGAYGYDNPTKTKLIIDSYSGCNKLIFKFVSAGSDIEKGGDSIVSYDGGFVSGKTIGLNLNFTKNATNTTPPVTGGGGGGGGGSTPIDNPINDEKNKVGIMDLALMMANWGKTGSNLQADLNNDGKVDIIDFALLMARWSLN